MLCQMRFRGRMVNREGLAPSCTSLKGWSLTPMRHGPWCPRLVLTQPPPACRTGALPMSYEGVGTPRGCRNPDLLDVGQALCL